MLRVVIVDDEHLVAELLKRSLEREGLARVIQTFSQPAEALERIPELKPDAVFLDIEMPGMSGIELAGRLMEQETDVQVVFVTAYNQYALEAFKVNAIDYLLKPVLPDELAKTLKRLGKYKVDRPALAAKHPYRIRCFGGFEATGRTGAPVRWISSKTAELLAFFILHRNRQIDKWTIGEALWPNLNEQKLNSNLHTTLFRLRKTLQEEGIPIRILSEKGSRQGYLCQVDDEADCDLVRFDARRGPIEVDERSLSRWEALLETSAGELFGSLDYPWSNPERERYNRVRTELFKEMAEVYSRKEQLSRALQWLARCPIGGANEEDIHRLAVANLLQLGDRQAAIRYYTVYKERMRLELDMDPDEPIISLYERLLASLPTLP